MLVLSALVSGSETAFFSLTGQQVQGFDESTDSRKRRIATLLNHPRRLLATILILNNLVNIFIVTFSSFVTWQILGSEEENTVHIVYLTATVTLTIVFFGEIIPKIYANQNKLPFAKSTATMLTFASKIFYPISWVLLTISRMIEKKIGKTPLSLSVEEINQALEISAAKEEVSEKEKGMLKGIVNFGTLSVKQVMRNRTDITAIEMNTDYHELMNQINKTGYSRIPIFSETIDKIEGIIYIKDLLPYLDEDETFNWQNLVKPAFFVPDSKKIDDLFKDFQRRRVHIAVVIDEYGGTDGIITMEDVIEEIIGEINDEFDEEQHIAYNKLDYNTYIFEGKTSLNDFCKIIHHDISIFNAIRGECESLGGLLLEINSKLPHAGQKISFERFVFTVMAVDARRIKKIRVFIDPEKINN